MRIMPRPTMPEFKRPMQRYANDNRPSRPMESGGRQQRHATRLALFVFGLLSLTIGSCLLGISAVEVLLRWT
jgi:hypothetical protein